LIQNRYREVIWLKEDFMPRALTLKKELLLKAVQSHPGLCMSQLVKLTGVPQWAAQKILPELAGRGLIYYCIAHPHSLRMRKWYAVKGI